MTAARWLGALALTLAVQAPAQAPTVDAAATAVRAVPLPVLDDRGDVIPEDLIRATMRDQGSVWPVLIGAAVGALVFGGVTSPGPDCSIYDPCTPQEEFYGNQGWKIGIVTGALIGAALSSGKVDREMAVKLLRERRGSTGRQP